MIPRLLKIDQNQDFPPLTGLSAPPKTLIKNSALVLLEDPDQTLVRSLGELAAARPEILQIDYQSAQELILRVGTEYLLHGPENALPGPALAELLPRLRRQAENYLMPVFARESLYGLDLDRVRIMGILNVTPDSFSDGGAHGDPGQTVAHALRMIGEGAAIIDIGGESSRPGASAVSAGEEIRRVIPVIGELRRQTDCLISVDTTKALVAARALEAGADWINDISALQSDPQMTEVIRQHACPVVIMHMLGTPQTMQADPLYQNVCLEVDDFFSRRIAVLLEAGIEKIILDPGIGFGKRLQDNLDLIKGAECFRRHGFPLLYGTSRKSFIGLITGRPVGERLAGSLATVIPLLRKGVKIVRVHDVAATKDVIDMFEQLE